MNHELVLVAENIQRAVFPEDIFGHFAETDKTQQLKALNHTYRKFAPIVFPEAHLGNAGDYKIAEEAFKRLNDFKALAKKAIESGQYGQKITPSGKTSSTADQSILIKDKYIRYAGFASGDIADLHAISFEEKGLQTEGLLKITRAEADNELLATERDVLLDLHAKFKGHDWDTCLPVLHDSFLIDDGKTSLRLRANVLEKFDRFLTAEQIHALVPDGVDGRTIAWMWKRLLLLLDWVHNLGYVHGAVLPPHVLYFPDNNKDPKGDKRRHSVRLIDWCYAVKNSRSSKLKAWCPDWQGFYAPEVLAKQSVGPYTDLYMGAKTMLYLLGGNVKANIFPSSLPKGIVASLTQCLERDPDRRPQNIRRYFDSFVAALEHEYGKPKFHFFNLPGLSDS